MREQELCSTVIMTVTEGTMTIVNWNSDLETRFTFTCMVLKYSYYASTEEIQ